MKASMLKTIHNVIKFKPSCYNRIFFTGTARLVDKLDDTDGASIYTYVMFLMVGTTGATMLIMFKVAVIFIIGCYPFVRLLPVTDI